LLLRDLPLDFLLKDRPRIDLVEGPRRTDDERVARPLDGPLGVDSRGHRENEGAGSGEEKRTKASCSVDQFFT
jgi:hypothetical protein